MNAAKYVKIIESLNRIMDNANILEKLVFAEEAEKFATGATNYPKAIHSPYPKKKVQPEPNFELYTRLYKYRKASCYLKK